MGYVMKNVTSYLVQKRMFRTNTNSCKNFGRDLIDFRNLESFIPKRKVVPGPFLRGGW